MVRRTLRKQRGGSKSDGGDGDGFNGASLQSGGNRRRKTHNRRKSYNRRNQRKTHNRRKSHNRRNRRKHGGNPVFLTPAVLLAAQKLVQHNGLAF